MNTMLLGAVWRRSQCDDEAECTAAQQRCCLEAMGPLDTLVYDPEIGVLPAGRITLLCIYTVTKGNCQQGWRCQMVYASRCSLCIALAFGIPRFYLINGGLLTKYS
jgi:hypothetical protein